MFKFFYKTLLIALVSVTLTAFDFSVAYAEAAATATATTAESSNMSRGSDGVVRRTETHSTSEVEDDDMMASLAMFGGVGATTLTVTAGKGSMVMDALIASAGAFALLAGEVMATMGHKTALKAMTMEITKSSDGKNDQAQIDHLNTLKKSYDDAKKTLGTKKTFQTAAAVIYGVAAVALAVNMAICGAALFGAPACWAALVVKNDDVKLMNQSLYAGQRLFAQYQFQAPRENKSLINNILDFILPRAQAGLLPIGLGITSAAAVTVMTTTAGTLRTALTTPWIRLVTWGVIGGLCLAAASATQSQMDKIEENTKKIDKILADMNALQKGTQLNKMTEQQIKLGSLQAQQTEELKLNADPNVKSDCLISEGSSNCKSIADTLQAMPSFQNLPDSLKALGSQAAALGDGLSGTNTVSASTMASANSLAGKSGAIKKMKNATQRKLNEALAKEKKPKMDLDKEQAKLLSKMKASAARELKSHNMTPSEFLASVGASPVSSTAKVLDEVASKKKGEVAAVGAAAPGKAKDDLNFDFMESPKEPELAVASAEAGSAAKNEDLDVGSNDINTDSGVNIFQLISNRYFKSGYPKLLEEVPAKK